MLMHDVGLFNTTLVGKLSKYYNGYMNLYQIR